MPRPVRQATHPGGGSGRGGQHFIDLSARLGLIQVGSFSWMTLAYDGDFESGTESGQGAWVLFVAGLFSHAVADVIEQFAGRDGFVCVRVRQTAQAFEQSPGENAVTAAPERAFGGGFVDIRRSQNGASFMVEKLFGEKIVDVVAG